MSGPIRESISTTRPDISSLERQSSKQLFERVVPQAVGLAGIGPWPQLALFVRDFLSVVVEVSGRAFPDERGGVDGDFADVVNVGVLRFQTRLYGPSAAAQCLADDPCDVAALVVERLGRGGVESTLEEADDRTDSGIRGSSHRARSETRGPNGRRGIDHRGPRSSSIPHLRWRSLVTSKPLANIKQSISYSADSCMKPRLVMRSTPRVRETSRSRTFGRLKAG